MDLLLYNYEYPPLGGGAGRASAHVASYLARRGHRVRVLTSAWSGRAHRLDPDGVEIIGLPALRKKIGESSLIQMNAYMASACGWTMANLACLRGCVALVFFGVPGGPPALLARTLARVPYVVSLRGGDVPGFRKGAPPWIIRLVSPLLRLIWREASRVVANSDALADLARRFEPSCPIDVVPNGVDTELFRPREGPREEGPLRVVSVGRLQEQKGFDRLIQAVGRQPRGTAELTIVGDGPLRRSLERLAREERLAVRFPGWLDQSSVAEEFRRADAFALLSHDEGMSNALLEGMATGLPCVVTDIPPNREVLGGSATGRLVHVDDVIALAGCLSELAWSLELRQSLGESARRRAIELSWEAQGDRMEMILEAAFGLH